MIKKFYVENFRSIKNGLTIDFEATSLKDETSYYNYFEIGNYNIQKVMSYYGMNASGKSNIIKAFSALKMIVLSNTNEPLKHDPFKLSMNSLEAPTKFTIEFSLNNDVESPFYRYTLSYNKETILFECLEKRTSQKYSNIYKRDLELNSFDTDKNTNLGKSLLLFSKAVKPYRTILSAIQELQFPEINDVITFFRERLIVKVTTVDEQLDLISKDQEINPILKSFTIKLLNAADINIKDIQIIKVDRPKALLTSNDSNLFDYKMFFNHGGELKDCFIEFVDESLGTKKMVFMAQELFKLMSKSSVFVVDELEASLHPELTKFIVSCFLDSEFNPKNTQLIFSSHETSLLDLDLLRRDEINFVYKDNNNCGTYIRSLSEFGVRKTDNIAKSYLAGRYNTTPEINASILNNYEK